MAVLEMAERFFEAMLKKWPTISPQHLSEKYGLHKALFNKHTCIIMAYENRLVSLDKPGLIKPLFRFWVYVAGVCTLTRYLCGGAWRHHHLGLVFWSSTGGEFGNSVHSGNYEIDFGTFASVNNSTSKALEFKKYIFFWTKFWVRLLKKQGVYLNIGGIQGNFLNIQWRKSLGFLYLPLSSGVFVCRWIVSANIFWLRDLEENDTQISVYVFLRCFLWFYRMFCWLVWKGFKNQPVYFHSFSFFSGPGKYSYFNAYTRKRSGWAFTLEPNFGMAVTSVLSHCQGTIKQKKLQFHSRHGRD